jgi:ribosomal-protein-alanine N-acetyltransferase
MPIPARDACLPEGQNLRMGCWIVILFTPIGGGSNHLVVGIHDDRAHRNVTRRPRRLGQGDRLHHPISMASVFRMIDWGCGNAIQHGLGEQQVVDWQAVEWDGTSGLSLYIRFSVNLSLQHLSALYLDQVVEIDRTCFGQLWSANQYQREFDSPNSDILILLDTDRQQVIAYGCIWAIVDEAHITIIAVQPDQQQKSYGTLILIGLMQAAIARELARATLEVRVSNQTAIRLYEKFGFETLGQRKKYYEDTGEDALIMWKSRIQSNEMRSQLAKIYDRIYQILSAKGINLTVSLDTKLAPNVPVIRE